MPEYEDASLAYTNVNTPQTIDTWKRVWDSGHVTKIPDSQIFIPCTTPDCSSTPRSLIKVDTIIIKEII